MLDIPLKQANITQGYRIIQRRSESNYNVIAINGIEYEVSKRDSEIIGQLCIAIKKIITNSNV